MSSDNYPKKFGKRRTCWAWNLLLSWDVEQRDSGLFKAVPLGVCEATFNEALAATLSPNSLVLINYLDMHLTLLGKLMFSYW